MLVKVQRSLSYILPHEEEEAKKIVEDALGFPAPIMHGTDMAVKVYVRDEDIVVTTMDGKKVSICIPPVIAMNDSFRSCTALVLSQGPDCYKSDRFKKSGPWCKAGDFICMPRNEGQQMNYRGAAIQVIEHDKIYHPIEKPTDIYKYQE